MRLDEWNERYRSCEEIAGEPAPLLVRAAESLAPGLALDLACGAGRNAIWLASRMGRRRDRWGVRGDPDRAGA